MKMRQSEIIDTFGCWGKCFWGLIKFCFYYSGIFAFYGVFQAENKLGFLLYGLFALIVFIARCISKSKKKAEEQVYQQKVWDEHRMETLSRNAGAVVYPQILQALPKDNFLENLTREKGIAALTQFVRNHANAEQLFVSHPSQEVLEFIHLHNPDGAYKICIKHGSKILQSK